MVRDEPKSYEYLFIDIEWNQRPGTTGIEDREPIQIGIVAADESLLEKKTFSRAIRLKDSGHYNPETLKVAHVTCESIMQANSEEVVLQKVMQIFPKFRYAVVWTRDTYELLKRGIKTYGLSMPRHRVVEFQSILMQITDDGKTLIGFEKALIQWEIAYKKNFLHYSKHDAAYLFQLFRKCYSTYQKWTSQEFCYLNSRSHILHMGNCRYVTRNVDDAIQKVAKESIFRGNRVCKICGCEREWSCFKRTEPTARKITDTGDLRNLPLTVKNMSQICNRFHLKYNIISDMVFVHTEFSRWIIYLKDNEVNELKHENYRQTRSQALKAHKKCMEGYHTKQLPSNNFYDVISYIKYHDKGMIHRLSRKTRMEKIFDMIKN